jgi:hypothetical protein
MFDVIAHKEGAKLIQKYLCCLLRESVVGEGLVKRKKPGLFHGYRDWIFIGGTKKTMIGTVNNEVISRNIGL